MRRQRQPRPVHLDPSEADNSRNERIKRYSRHAPVRRDDLPHPHPLPYTAAIDRRGSNVYPNPRTEWMNLGLAGSSSTLCRSRNT